MAAKAKRNLGSHLEWHGNRIRVVMAVPPSLRAALGKNKLKETLNTADPALADIAKHRVLEQFKRTIRDAKRGTAADPLLEQAFVWRDAIKAERDRWQREGTEADDSGLVAPGLAMETAEALSSVEGEARAALFAGVAMGTATPIRALMEEWIASRPPAPSTAYAWRQALAKFEAWCRTAEVTPVLERITSKIAARFVTEAFETPKTDPATANKLIGALSTYWRWLLAKEHLDPAIHANVWTDKRLAKRKAHREEGERDKRPFTDDEVRTLLAGVPAGPLRDLCRISALSGMRLNEIAGLKAKHVVGGLFRIRLAKTKASQRDVPIHPDLAELVARRLQHKGSEAFLIHELPAQRNAARGRGAPVSQAFTRARRRLGVCEAPVARQDRIDFHSWRRWFIRKAGDALKRGATGYDAWTIAEVVGHDKEQGALPLTMGRYPGRDPVEARRACVEAVQLPPD